MRKNINEMKEMKMIIVGRIEKKMLHKDELSLDDDDSMNALPVIHSELECFL